MWSPTIHVSNENDTPALQTPQRKSVGRTPLQDLTVQCITLSETKCSSNIQSSMTKLSYCNKSVHQLHLKDSSTCNTGTTVNILADLCPKDVLKDTGENEMCASQNIQPSPFSWSNFAEHSLDASNTNLEFRSTGHTSQPCVHSLLLEPVSSSPIPSPIAEDQEEPSASSLNVESNKSLIVILSSEVLCDELVSGEEKATGSPEVEIGRSQIATDVQNDTFNTGESEHKHSDHGITDNNAILTSSPGLRSLDCMEQSAEIRSLILEEPVVSEDQLHSKPNTPTHLSHALDVSLDASKPFFRSDETSTGLSTLLPPDLFGEVCGEAAKSLARPCTETALSLLLHQERTSQDKADTDDTCTPYILKKGKLAFPAHGPLYSPLKVPEICVTPISNSSAVTWTTPIMLLNKSMNTSWDLGNFVGKSEQIAQDNASETDSLLWNFSRESLRGASREELENRLEGTLIVVEVLSRQLQGWQKDQRLCSRPSEQRETSTQTFVTHSSLEEKYYHDMYIRTMGRLESMQRSHEEEEQLKQMLGDRARDLDSHMTLSASMIEFAENMYENTQRDKVDMSHKISQVRTLLADHLTLLNKMEGKMRANLLHRDEMTSCMEDALRTKEATDQCFRDLELHSSAVISQLQRDSASEKKLCAALKDAYEQQLSYNDEMKLFAERARSVCSVMEDDQNHLRSQCSQARELMSRHWHVLEALKERTQKALQVHDVMESERDSALLEKKGACNQLEDMKSQNDQLIMETTRLGSELASLIEHLCGLESEKDHLKQENAEHMDKLSAKDTSLKLVEEELNEATARERAVREHNQQLSEVVLRLERSLSETENQKQRLQIKLDRLKTENLSQIAAYTESLEFIQEESTVCREQSDEAESQLKTNLFALRERNLQCETQKDTIQELQRERDELQEALLTMKCDARDLLLKMGKEISDSSMEVFQIRERLLDLTEQMRDALQEEAAGTSYLPRTPSGPPMPPSSNSLVSSVLKAQWEECRPGSIWSETSAFIKVQPVPAAAEVEENLPDVLRQLGDIVSNLCTSSSRVIETKQQEGRELKREISSLKEDLQCVRYQYISEIRELQEETENLRMKAHKLDEALTCKKQCILQLENLVDQQEGKVLQLLSKEREQEDMFLENPKLKRSLQLLECEASVLKEELAKSHTEAARDWMQEKLLLHQDLTKLRILLLDTENDKSEIVHRSMRHREILEGNLFRSEKELKKLDDLIDKIRGTLQSIPDVVSSCEELRHLMECLS
ncbi:sperm-associated antigen 5 isoform X2 [Ascaphus truei]|uniref:sperm-associated antigen 5 isoform X2 n=1 Tax=Ascaphus truei TaxID=8439 RepID=UPI003F59CC25